MSRLVWKDRIVEKPRTYQMQHNDDGTITLVPAPGMIIQEGTPVNAGNLNRMADECRLIEDIVTSEKWQWGMENGVAYLEKVVG